MVLAACNDLRSFRGTFAGDVVGDADLAAGLTADQRTAQGLPPGRAERLKNGAEILRRFGRTDLGGGAERGSPIHWSTTVRARRRDSLLNDLWASLPSVPSRVLQSPNAVLAIRVGSVPFGWIFHSVFLPPLYSFSHM